MNKNQAKHYLLSLDEEVFIKLHNDYMVDPYEFSSMGIYTMPNDSNDMYDDLTSRHIEFRDFWNIATNELSHFDEDDKYYFLADYLFSFSTIEELMATQYGDCVAEEFLDKIDEYMETLKEINTNE